jgi:hypothetical protein
MARQSLVPVFAFVLSILAILGMLDTAPVASGYAKQSAEITAAQAQVSDCSERERGDRGTSSCGICIDLCAAAFAAILPDAASATPPVSNTTNPLDVERFSDWRVAPDDSPPRA